MLHNTVLVSVAQQSESAICIHMSPYPLPLVSPSHPPYPTPLGHHKAWSRSISLCYAAASHQPTILYLVMYICRCYPHFAPASPSHPMSSSLFSVYLFIPALQLGSSVPFFKIPYICVSIRYLFFSFRLTSLCMTPHYK